MFSRTFVRASNLEGLRRSMRQERTQERRIALGRRWYVGGLATLVASSLVFTGISPAVAEEVTPTDTVEQTATIETTDASTEAPAAEEPAPPAEEPPAPPAPPAKEEPAPEPPAPPAEDEPAKEPAAPSDDESKAEDAATEPRIGAKSIQSLAAPEIAAFALPCVGSPALGSPVAGFEIDGNLCLDGAGTIDWATLGNQPVANDGYKDNTSFTNGSAEDNWPNWGIFTQIGGPAQDIGNVYAYSATHNGRVYAFMAFERDAGNGTIAYYVELNKKKDNLNGPIPDRSVGDLRLVMRQDGQTTTISFEQAAMWDGSSWQAFGSSAAFVGRVNQGDVENLAGEVVGVREFAEVSIDLTALFENVGCSGTYGVMNVRSNASVGESSAMKDWVAPIPLQVPSTCATLEILKTDTAGNPLQGAEFTIEGVDGTFTTDADGLIVQAGLEPGEYTVTETKAPTGYLLPEDTSQTVMLGTSGTERVTFVDPLGSGAWLKHNGDGQLLGGATFQLSATGGAAAAAPWAATFPKTVVDNGANDADPVAGQIEVVNLPTGTYTITETAAPSGYVLDATQERSFTVSDDNPHTSITDAFVNIPLATVTLTKNWVKSFPGDTAQLSITGGGPVLGSGTSTAPTNGVPVVSVTVAPGSSLTLAEVLGAQNTGLYTSTLACVGATVTGNTGTGGSITVPAYPASKDGVQCTFTNTAVEKKVTLRKLWVDSIAGDTAELVAGTDEATSVADGTPDQLDEVNVAEATVRVGDSVALSETLTGAGSYGSAYECSAGETTGDGTGTSFSLTVPDEDVVCTFSNTAERANVTLVKEWVNAFAGDEAHLAISGGAGKETTSVATEGDSTDEANAASVNVRLGEHVAMTETLDDGNVGEYTTTWSCDDGRSGTELPIASFEVTESVTCTITNTAKTIDVELGKRWIDAFAGDTATLTLNGGTGVDSEATGVVNQLDGALITKEVRIGDTVTIEESLAGTKGTYTSTYSCSAVVENGVGDGREFEFVAPDENVVCVFINTAVKKTVTLQKAWVDGITGDEADLTIAAGPGGKLFGGTPTNTSTVTAETGPTFTDTGHTASAEVRVGDSVTLSEIVTGTGTYATEYECTNGAEGDVRSFSLLVPADNVTCTFTNTAARADVTLKKYWIGAFPGDEAQLNITGDAADEALAVASGTDGEDAESASVSVRLGESVTLSETITDADNQGRYDASWECDDETNGEGGTIDTITVTESIVCTITNTAKRIDITVDKRWINAFQGDEATVWIGDESAVSTADGSLNQLDEGVVTRTVRVGENVTVQETIDDEANTGRYDSAYACTVVDQDGEGRSVQFVAPEEDVLCAFTNTARKVEVTLHKRWIDSITGSQAELGLDTLTRVSLAPGLLGERLDEVGLTLPVRVGTILPLRETMNDVGSYSSHYLCTTGVTSGTGEGREFTLTVGDTDSACFFVNRALTSTVNLVKTWVNGQAGDTADLSLTGVGLDESGTSTADGSVGSFTDAENLVTGNATIGSTVSVAEVIDVIHGSPSDYATSLVCTAEDETVLLSTDDLDGTFTMPNQPVWCEFTNTAELPTIALVKVVSGADVADTNWQLTATPEEGDVVTNPAGGEVTPTQVVTDVPFSLSESLLTEFPGSNEFAAGEWSCVNEEGAVAVTDSVPGAAELRGLNKGEDVVCMIVNAHVDQGFEFDKSLVGSEQLDDGTWLVTYAITVHNNSVVVPIEYDLSDTLGEPEDGVRYLDASWSGPTSGDYDLASGLTAVLTTDDELPPYDAEAGNDEVYTVVVHVAVDAVPVAAEECSEGSGGIGVVNQATLTVGEESDTDDACGTVHFDDVEIVKTASGLPEGGSVEPGTEFDYVLTVTNNGTRDAEDVVVTDAIPDRLEVTAIELPAGWANDNAPDLVDGDNVLSASTSLFAVGESVEIVVTVTLTPTAVAPVDPSDGPVEPPVPLEELVNTACVAAERDQVAENDCSTVEIPVREITAAVYTRCVADAPLLGWTISKSASLVGDEIQFLWTPDTGTAGTVPPNVAITQPGGTATWSDEIEWPGSEFTPSGVSIDYPGWRPIEAGDIVPGSIPTQYYYPGTTDVIAAGDVADFVFNGLILDDSELDYAWRLASTVTFSVNPTLTFTTEYPPATEGCAAARHSDVQIEKTASVEKTDPGASFTYTLDVANVSDDAAAESVVVTDAIPADIKVTDVTWDGEGDDEVFPNWQSCEVTGQNSSGYGGNLECVLYGPLQPQGANEGASSAPTITLAATVNPKSAASSITNVAVVDYHTFGDPDDPGRDSDDATVLLSALPATGGEPAPLLVILGLLALLAGATMVVVTRRRRGEARPMV